jgi:pilus assembly protein CpaB
LARLPSAGRTIAVVLALVLAAGATIAIFLYVRGIEERAFGDAELVEIFVAQGEVPAGTAATDAADAGLLARDTAPRVNVPEGAITGLEQIDGLFTVESILPGEIVLRDRWGASEEVAVGFEIPEGFEALSVEVQIPPGVAGYIRGGDRISLIATVETPGETVTDPDGTVTEEPGEVLTQYLLQGIEVLTVGQRTIETEEPQAAPSTVLLTVALVPEDAERMVFAIENASLYFTLLPEGAEPQETPGRRLEDLFN